MSPIDDIVDEHHRPSDLVPGLEHDADDARDALVRVGDRGWAEAAKRAAEALQLARLVIGPRTFERPIPDVAATFPTKVELVPSEVSALSLATSVIDPGTPTVPGNWIGATVQDAMRRFIAESKKGACGQPTAVGRMTVLGSWTGLRAALPATTSRVRI